MFNASEFTVNLSGYLLEDAHISLLDKGLTFIPKINSFPASNISEAQNYIRRSLMLKDFFIDKLDSNHANEFSRKFIPQSSWLPPWSSITEDTKKTISHIFRETTSSLSSITVGQGTYTHIINKHTGYNLTKEEYRALKDLKNKPEIIIKPADKGGAIVIMDHELYVAEGLRQLNNDRYYKRLSEPIYVESAALITKELTTLRSKGFINDKQFTYLSPGAEIKRRQFYLLPKIHKNREKWPHTCMPEGRPIVSDVNSETYRISEYIDYFLQPLAITHESYIKDTYDFVDKIRDTAVNKSDLLVTGDVTALYTNMNITRILQTVRDIFNEFPVLTRPDEQLLNLLEITLSRNDFAFGDLTFLQVCGTAMGKKYAPSLANIYLRKFDQEARNGFHIKPKIYWRYLDDIYLIWPGNKAELEQYQNFLNSIIPGITVTLVAKSNITEFLDTRTYKHITPENKCLIKTKVFFKPTDTHQLLHKRSYHPKHTFKGLLKSQFIRFKRISSFRIEYEEACNILKRVLLKRGYASRLFRAIKKQVWESDGAERRKRNNSGDSSLQRLPIITYYDNVSTTLNRKWKGIIEENKTISKHFKSISAYRIHKNLSKHLVRSTLHPANPPMHATQHKAKFAGCKRCTNTRCKACNHMIESKNFISSHNHRRFTLENGFTCKSSNIIYLITCQKCNKQYVGETGRSLADRITDHLSCIRLKKVTPIGLHFNLQDHSSTHLKIQPIEQINRSDDQATNVRRHREQLWQRLLQTTHPTGINNVNQDNIT